MSSEGGFTLAPADVPWLDDGPAAKLLAVLDAGGEEARAVGGAVRNTLMQLPPGDVDIATTALPEEVLRRARAAGFHPVPTGIEHGTVTVVVAGTPFEVTTLRQDIETDGRHAAVRFGRDWQADAERRDFTMNALFLTRERRVIDFVGGVADIEARRVRFIGDPDTRIREDYLRILRFFRFFAAHGEGVPEGASLAACIRNRGGLAQLSRERVRVETMKLLPGKRAAEAATAMAESGILDRVLAGVADLPALTRMAAIETAMQLEPDAVRRLAALAVRVVEDAERLRERLRLSNDEYRRLVAVGDGWWRVLPSADDAAARTLLYRLGADAYRDRALVAFARARMPEPAAWAALLSLPERWTPPKFPLSGKDFLARGLAKGPALGAALRRAEKAWIAAGFPTEPERAAAIADEVVKVP
ncbi:MAG TPA: CCA tRNA nucleotidyltransferase [Xanthobacteraceae bacterium]|nr:CCA tRNA nucleotidyltransferase [Xanthobacteraceae bacterium]